MCLLFYILLCFDLLVVCFVDVARSQTAHEIRTRSLLFVFVLLRGSTSVKQSVCPRAAKTLANAGSHKSKCLRTHLFHLVLHKHAVRTDLGDAILDLLRKLFDLCSTKRLPGLERSPVLH